MMQRIDPHPSPELSGYLRPPAALPPDWQLYASGRHALAAIAEHERLQGGDTVYLPALHCAAMVDPFISRGASVRYYPIQRDLGADTRWLEDEARRTRPRFLLGVHFFGFPCPRMPALRELAEQYGASFIEDCAHELMVAGWHGRHAWGHWRISSPHKFLGSGEGGLLVAGPDREAPPQPPDGGFMTGARILLREMQRRSPEGNTLRVWGLRLAERMYRVLKREHRADVPNPANSGDTGAPVPVRPITRVGRRVVSRVNAGEVAARRSIVANRIRNAFPDHVWSGLQWPENDFTPYVVPFWHVDADAFTERLRMRGISVLRFGHYRHDSYQPGVCQVADSLSRHLVQLPCHQQLADPDVEELLSAVRESLNVSVQ